MSAHSLYGPLAFLWLLITVGGILIIGKGILIPLAFAILFAFLLRPMKLWLQKRLKAPRILATLIPVIVMVITVVVIVGAVSFALSGFIRDIPTYGPQITETLRGAQTWAATTFSISVPEQSAWLSENVNLLELGAAQIPGFVSGATGVVGIIMIMIVYTFLIMLYDNKFKRALVMAAGEQRSASIEKTIRSIGRVIPSYLRGLLIVMVIIAILASAGYAIAGVPNPIFFGILTALLNLIPYIGTAIGFGAVLIFALLTQGVPSAIIVAIVFGVVQFLDNNILTPNIAAGQINVNALAAIVGIFLGGVMWGVSGMILAIPVLGDRKSVV